MLSKAEVQFLKGEKQVSANYARVPRYRIRAKARTPRAVSDDPETWQAAHSLGLITEKRNGITEFCNGLRSGNSENEGIGRARRYPSPNGFESTARNDESATFVAFFNLVVRFRIQKVIES
jgi:hypothetical protein